MALSSLAGRAVAASATGSDRRCPRWRLTGRRRHRGGSRRGHHLRDPGDRGLTAMTTHRAPQGKGFRHVLRSVSAGDQLGPDVYRRGIGADVGRRGGLGRAGHRIAVQAATSYSSVISSLTSGPWLGPSSLSMAAAVAPYLDLDAGHRRAGRRNREPGHRGGQRLRDGVRRARAPPAEIAANRAQLASLVATNIIGQNNAAIAATEAQYGEMWAQDAAAMDTYAASSAAASTADAVSPSRHRQPTPRAPRRSRPP